MREDRRPVSRLERESWLGRPVLDPSGVRIGHVRLVTPGPLGGAWIRIRCEWGVLDWLNAMGGGGGPSFIVHSDDVIEQRGALRLDVIVRHPSPTAA